MNGRLAVGIRASEHLTASTPCRQPVSASQSPRPRSCARTALLVLAAAGPHPLKKERPDSERLKKRVHIR
eukprot:scaffold598133_cov20-Prasinocladus_malaysianus.AAC.1